MFKSLSLPASCSDAGALGRAEEARRRRIAETLAASRAQTQGGARAHTPSGTSLTEGIEAPPPPTIDICDALDKLLAAQLQHMAESAPRDAPPPDAAHLRRLLHESDLSPECITRQLARKLESLCTYEYPAPMPQSNRKHGMGHSSIFIREHMTRELDNMIRAMMTVLRTGRVWKVPSSAVWQTSTGNISMFGSAGVEEDVSDGNASDGYTSLDDDAPLYMPGTHAPYSPDEEASL
jgi:hypothetical protein